MEVPIGGEEKKIKGSPFLLQRTVFVVRSFSFAVIGETKVSHYFFLPPRSTIAFILSLRAFILMKPSASFWS